MSGFVEVPVRRPGYARALALVGVGLGLIGAPVARHAPLLLWNATASAPLGLYAVASARKLNVGDWAAYAPPAPLARWLADGGYAPRHVLLVKRVAATAGQSVCRQERRISIDGTVVADVRNRSRRGQPLPVWRGCRKLGPGEILLLNASEDSLDGRYFGPSRLADVVGRAAPFWIWGRAR